MIDTWFNNDIQEVFSKHSVVVFIDESGAAEFLLKSLDKDCTVHYVSNDVDELKAKYIIEKTLQEQPASTHKFVIYTQIAKKQLTFVREYCETSGYVEIRYLHNYIKTKVLNPVLFMRALKVTHFRQLDDPLTVFGLGGTIFGSVFTLSA